jgi:hypothetical protein
MSIPLKKNHRVSFKKGCAWRKEELGVLPQALEIIFEVQMKWSNEKIARRKISFPTHKM